MPSFRNFQKKGSNALNILTAGLQRWMDQLYATFIETEYYTYLIEGLINTILITVGALLIGVVIGLAITIGKYLCEDVPALKPIAWLCDLYVNVIRGIPVVVLLLIFFFIIMKTSNNGVLVAILTFGINSGAYMAELIRGGIGAVDKGQTEAGRSLGFSKLQTMSRIVIPQAVKHVLPAMGNEFIALLKETSVAGYVAVVDLTRGGNLIRNNTFDAVNPLLIVALTYLIMVFTLTGLLHKLERKLA